MNEAWRDAWERERDAVGRAVHEAWMAEKIRQGFADHKWVKECFKYCKFDATKHHGDMLDYAALAPNVQAYDIETGIVGFRMGYEAAKRDGAL